MPTFGRPKPLRNKAGGSGGRQPARGGQAGKNPKNKSCNLSVGLFRSCSGLTWRRDPFQRVRLAKCCRTHLKLAPETNYNTISWPFPFRSRGTGGPQDKAGALGGGSPQEAQVKVPNSKPKYSHAARGRYSSGKSSTVGDVEQLYMFIFGLPWGLPPPRPPP